MNIHTAAQYMKQGYRIRRSTWASMSYMTNFHGTIYGGWGAGESSIACSMADLLADDWEIIMDGIINNFPITYSS